MIKITVERKGKGFPKLEIEKALEKAAIVIQNEAIELCPADIGTLRQSITRKVSSNKATVGTNERYAPYVEFGTSPHFPPLNAIREWAGRVLGNEDAAFAIAKKIARHGTKPQSFLRKAVDIKKKQAIEVFKKSLFG